jgi:hypothetical protein
LRARFVTVEELAVAAFPPACTAEAFEPLDFACTPASIAPPLGARIDAADCGDFEVGFEVGFEVSFEVSFEVGFEADTETGFETV